MEKETIKLIDDIMSQAKLFLTDAGEFYPFGSYMKPDGTISPVGVYLENDHPESQDVLQILENAMKKRIEKKEAVVVGIGLDVLYKPDGESEKKDALKVMVLTNEGDSMDYYFPYKNKDGEFTFGKVFSETGTLLL